MKKLLLLSILVIITGCATTTDNLGDLSKRFDDVKKIETLLFNQMPLPKDARISPDKSLILGVGDNWAGRIELSSSMEPLEASAFFTTEYPKHGWQLISSTKAKLSILVFTSSTRTLTLEITEGGPLAAKSMIVMTVAPKVQNQVVPDPKK
jgi:hypothetical protein